MTLEELLNRLHSSDVLEDRLQSTLTAAREAVGAERGCLMVTRPGREQLLYDGDESLRLKYPFSRKVVGEVMVSGVGLVAFQKESRDRNDSMALHGIRAALCAPVLGPDEEDFGVIYFDSKAAGDNVFSESQLELIQGLAKEIGKALTA